MHCRKFLHLFSALFAIIVRGGYRGGGGVPLHMGKMGSICRFPVLCLLTYGETPLKS